MLCCLFQYNVISAPLTIEIDHGIEAVPHETGDVDKNTSSSFVQTIDASEFKNSQFDLSRIIENSSGIKVRRIGGIGSYSQVSIRGKSSDQVMVYVDGMLVNNASGGSVDLSQIPSNQIARIEIYKDAIPVEFSEASNGGVINIITHRSNNKKSSQFNSSIGSFNTYILGMNHFNHYKNWQFVISSSYITTKNNFSYNYENGTANNPFDDEIQTRKNNDLKQYDIVTKVKYLINEHQEIQYQIELFKKNKNIPSYSNSQKTKTLLINDNKFFNINYLNRNFYYKNIEISTNLKFKQNNSLYDDSEKQIGLIQRLVDQQTKEISSKIYTKYKTKNYQLINTTSLHYEHLKYDDFFETENTKRNKRITISSALQGNFYFENKKIIISPTGRLFYAHDNFNGKTLNESVDLNNIDKSYSTLTSQLGFRYQYWNSTHIKLNIGKYYRLPSYVELFGARGYIGSNESLKPEKGINFDIGFEHLSYPKSETFTKLDWNLSLFHSIIDDEITYSFNARGIGKPSNIGKSTISGIENNLSLEINYMIDINSMTTFILPLDKSDPNNTKLLAGRPLWTQTSQISISNKPINAYLEHIIESSFFFDSAQRLPSNQKSIFNTGIKYTSKHTQYDFTLNNIFNQNFKDFNYQVTPGRAIFFSIKINLT